MFPSSFLPESVAKFSKLLPTTYAMDAYEALATKGNASINPIISIGLLIACGIISYYLSWYLFRLDNNNTSKSKGKIWALGALLPFIIGAIFL